MTPQPPPGAPCLAAVTLDAHGGGVALVARLVREVFHRRWGTASQVFTLVQGDRVAEGTPPGLLARLEFGAQLAVHQANDTGGWTFYAHPSLARVQRHVPRPLRRPYAMFVHGIEAWRPLSRAEREVYDGAAVCLTNSTYTAGRVAEANPGLSPLVPCPLALVPDEARPGGRWNGPSIGPQAVVIVGRMSAGERYKGHDALLAAWPSVRARVPEAVLVCVGEGDDLPRLRALAEPLGAGAVQFPGFVTASELHALYDAAAVFAMPSRGEGFGLVYLEAMTHQLPCIGSVHDAAREIVVDGDTGYLVDQGDTDGLADRIVTLLRDENARRTMGRRGAERVTTHFSFERFERRLLIGLEAAGLVSHSPPAARSA